jgi:hypothetical protein
LEGGATIPKAQNFSRVPIKGSDFVDRKPIRCRCAAIEDLDARD